MLLSPKTVAEVRENLVEGPGKELGYVPTYTCTLPNNPCSNPGGWEVGPSHRREAMLGGDICPRSKQLVNAKAGTGAGSVWLQSLGHSYMSAMTHASGQPKMTPFVKDCSTGISQLAA